MQNKIVRIMDPLQEQTSLSGFSQDMAYTTTFQAIARMFMLAMGLSKSRRNHRISSWQREYPSYVTKVTSNHKDWYSLVIWFKFVVVVTNILDLYAK